MVSKMRLTSRSREAGSRSVTTCPIPIITYQLTTSTPAGGNALIALLLELGVEFGQRAGLVVLEEHGDHDRIVRRRRGRVRRTGLGAAVRIEHRGRRQHDQRRQ